jgi:hypothetical protein
MHQSLKHLHPYLYAALRKIEERMLEAVCSMTALKDKNTCVEIEQGTSSVFLFNKLIAQLRRPTPENELTQPQLRITDAGWPTKTTVSRLKPLLYLAPFLASIERDRGILRIKSSAQSLVMQSERWYLVPVMSGLRGPASCEALTDIRRVSPRHDIHIHRPIELEPLPGDHPGPDQAAGPDLRHHLRDRDRLEAAIR